MIRNWDKEDELYKPKRKINNNKSRSFHHNSGFLYSYKMRRDVGYESFWGECLFYYLLELDGKTKRYYEQPVQVPISSFSKNHTLDTWYHVPDVLVFRDESAPILVQIKGTDSFTETHTITDKFCKDFATKKGWIYLIVRPKNLHKVVKSNVLLLTNYIKPRNYNEHYKNELLMKVDLKKEITILNLAKSFAAKIDYRLMLPLIYHLIATGYLKVDLSKDINQNTLVSKGNISHELNTLYNLEVT